MFEPINLPPTEHHGFATGHSTEHGDNAMTVGRKINDGFKHVYGVLRGLGATLADEVEYVAKSEFDLLAHELEEAKAELANLKMMVQGLGFAGARKPVSQGDTPSLKSHEAVAFQASLGDGGTAPVVSDPVMVIGKLDAPSADPVVTVTEATEQ